MNTFTKDSKLCLYDSAHEIYSDFVIEIFIEISLRFPWVLTIGFRAQIYIYLLNQITACFYEIQRKSRMSLSIILLEHKQLKQMHTAVSGNL